MSERKAYRVEIRNLMLGQVSATNATDKPDALLVPWPEDCPWRFGDFPMPGTEVRDKDDVRMVVCGRPEKDVDGGWWVPVQYAGDRVPTCRRAEEFPAIWNARKDAKDERVVGTLTVLEGGDGKLSITHTGRLTEGEYRIIRREEP